MKVLGAVFAGALFGGMLVVAPAVADPVEAKTSNALTVPKAMRLLQNKGYSDFRKIKVEREENEVEVEARNKDGRLVEIEIDLYTGKILDIEND